MSAHASCSTAGCVPGGGNTRTDCPIEFLLTPVPAPAANGLPNHKAFCYEGDPLCDADPDIDNLRCDFPVALCINNADSRLPQCTPSDTAGFELRRPSAAHPRDSADAANTAALENAVNADLGITVLHRGEVALAGVANATLDACTQPVSIQVPLRQRGSRVRRGRRTLRLRSVASDLSRDNDSLRLECRPSTCGNGTVEPHEDCDDGNRINGDGCNQGCRIEPPTPTPSNTGTVTATPTVTPTFTHTVPPPPTATDTPVPTATASATATATASATNTVPPTLTATQSATATSTPTITDTVTQTPTFTPTPTHTLPSVTFGITAYRPQSEGYGVPFQRHAVPAGENLSPGVGVRINGDDDNGNSVPDFNENAVTGENDLVELTLQASPFPAPPGFEYALVRSDADIRVWNQQFKGNSAVLLGNDESVVTFSAATRTVWVERMSAGTTQLQLVARPAGGGTPIASTAVNLFSFTSVIIALGGENQVPSDPPDSNHGMFNIALTLYNMGYDVHMYDEDDVGSSGAGPAYDEVVRAVSRRDIHIVSIYGYSHGGGSTHDLAQRMSNNQGSIGSFTLPYTAYVDAIGNSSDIDITSETDLPPGTQYHVNYYQRNDLFIKGNSVSGANVNVNVTNTPWGADLDHGAIDDHPNVRDGVLQPLLLRVPR